MTLGDVMKVELDGVVIAVAQIDPDCLPRDFTPENRLRGIGGEYLDICLPARRTVTLSLRVMAQDLEPIWKLRDQACPFNLRGPDGELRYENCWGTSGVWRSFEGEDRILITGFVCAVGKAHVTEEEHQEMARGP